MGMPYAASPARSTAIRMSCSNSPSTAFASICSTKANILRGAYPVQDEADRLHYEIGLLVLNGVPALRRHDVDCVRGAPEPLVVHLAPRCVPAGGAVHPAGFGIYAHAGQDRERDIGEGDHSLDFARRLNAHRLAYLRRIPSGFERLEHRIEVGPERGGVSAVDRTPAPHLLLVRGVDQHHA